MIDVGYPWPGCEEWEEAWPDHWTDDIIRRWAKETPDKAALVDHRRPEPVTFRALDELVDHVVGGFRSLGLEPGDVVALQLPNWWEFVVLHLAAIRAGLVTCPVSPSYRQSELRHILVASGAKVLVVPEGHKGTDHVALAAAVLADLPSVKGCFAAGADAARAGVAPLAELFDAEPVPGEVAFDRHAAMCILFTSGSEAAPKAVVHTHATANYSLVACTDLWGVTTDDVVLVAAPISHGAGFNWCSRIALHLGATQVLLDEWKPEAAAAVINAEGCSFTYAPTRFLQDLLAVAAAGTPVTMRTFASGGSPIPRHFVEQARASMGCQVLATYGQTECFVATSTRLDDTADKIAATDGCAVPGAQVRIADTDDREVAVGAEGECHTRGPHVAAGYLDAEGRVHPFADDGWLRTGDLCTMDDDGYIRVVGRAKEIIIRNGLNISPAEVESHLLKLPGIRQAAVVGYPDELVGERTCAAVVVDDGRRVTLEEVTALLDEVGIARYKFPERLVVVDEIPHSAVGKIQRREVRRQLVEADEIP